MQDRIGPQFAFGVIILAAGASRRMGRPKLLLPWFDTSVLGFLIGRWTTLAARQIAVVTAADARDIQDELSRLDFAQGNRICNPAPERGMFSSIQCAANWPGWRPELTHWLLTLGDQPHLAVPTLRQLLALAEAHPENICQPLRHGRPRHPVVLPKEIFEELKHSTAADLKAFLGQHAHRCAGFESDDAGLDLDLDTPEDYERLRPKGPHPPERPGV